MDNDLGYRGSLRWVVVAWVNDEARSAKPALCILGDSKENFGCAAKRALCTHNVQQGMEGRCFYDTSTGMSIRLLGNKTTRRNMQDMSCLARGAVIYFYRTENQKWVHADVHHAISTWKRTYTKALKEALKAFLQSRPPCGGAQATRLTIEIVGLDTPSNCTLPIQKSLVALTAVATPSPTLQTTQHTMVAVDSFASHEGIHVVPTIPNAQALPPSVGTSPTNVTKDVQVGAPTTLTVDEDRHVVATKHPTANVGVPTVEEDVHNAQVGATTTTTTTTTTFTVEEDDYVAATNYPPTNFAAQPAIEADVQDVQDVHTDVVPSCTVVVNAPCKGIKPQLSTLSETTKHTSTSVESARLGADLLFSTSEETRANKACHKKSTLVGFRKPTKRKLELLQAAVELANAMTDSAVRQQQVEQLEKTLQDAKKAHIEAQSLVKELTNQLVY
jgi:hypothetical protein